MLLRLVVLLLLCAVPAFAETWTNFATISGTPSALVICNLDSSADDLQCPATNPVIDASGHVGIGTASPAASALLELKSTTLGFLPPRMDTTARNAISSPATGLT